MGHPFAARKAGRTRSSKNITLDFKPGKKNDMIFFRPPRAEISAHIDVLPLICKLAIRKKRAKGIVYCLTGFR
jgi:hypothetical protein